MTDPEEDNDDDDTLEHEELNHGDDNSDVNFVNVVEGSSSPTSDGLSLGLFSDTVYLVLRIEFV